jgi:hypothetical protein
MEHNTGALLWYGFQKGMGTFNEYTERLLSNEFACS